MEKSGIQAIGHPVPASRIQSTYELIINQIDKDINKGVARRIANRCAEIVERDETSLITAKVVEPLLANIDLTARYMVLSSLLTNAQLTTNSFPLQ